MRPGVDTTIRLTKPPYRWLPLLITLTTAVALGTGGLALHLVPIQAVSWKLGLAGSVVLAPMLGLLLWMTGRLRVEWATAQERGEQLAATLTSIGDAVIVTDERGQVVFVNPVAQALTGWTQDNAVGRDLGAVFTIVNEATRHPVESPAAKVLREGVVAGLANHTLLIARDGAERPIDDSGAPIRDETGRLHGVVLVFRDVSKRRLMEAMLRNRAEALRSLAEAAQRITAEWDLAQILRYIVETAARLTGAKYGALGVFDETGERLTDFITTGVDEETERAIGALPTGRGLLGFLSHKEEVLRLKDLTQHPASTGFPPGHPPMRAFLGVSIRARGRLFGRIYLAEKEGADEFTEVDAEVISALAAHAGIAIENANHLATARAAEAKHRFLLESTGEGIFGVDAQARCTFINKAGATMLGYRPEEAIGRNMHELVHHSHPDGSPYPIAECPIVTCRSGSGCRCDEDVLWRRDRTSFPVEYSAHPILEESRIMGTVVVFTDITERKKMEAALKESLGRFDVAVRGSNEGLWDVQHVPDLPPFSPHYPIWYSPRFKALLGYEDHELPNVLGSWLELLHPDDKDLVLAALAAHLERNVPYDVEYRLLTKSGAYHWFRARGQAIQDEAGVPIRMAGSLQDVTEWKQLEEQLRQAAKMEAIGRLAGGVAHDFNNLLMVINGYSATLLKKLGPNNPLRRYPLEIKKAGDRAATLTQQLLAFSQRQVSEPTVLDLNDCVTGMNEMLTRLIGKHVEMVSSLDLGLGPVKADRGQMEQVIMNLAINARDAMPERGTLTIKTANIEIDGELARLLGDVPPGAYVMLAVSDTGHGMDEATKARIFEPFFTTKEQGKGTGLGLAIVYGIVNQSGGSIMVQSEPGGGTTFTIYLPRVTKSAPASQKVGPAGEASIKGSETILLAEDEETVRSLMCEILQEAGYRVLDVRDGAEALVLSAEYAAPIHLLLTDVVMPHVGGRELADLLVRARPGTKVLYMTGYTDDVIIQQGILEQSLSVLQKPVSPETLLRKVREVLDAHEPRPESGE